MFMFLPPPPSNSPTPSPEEVLRRAREVVEQSKIGNPGYQAPIVQKKCDCGAAKANTTHALWCETMKP